MEHRPALSPPRPSAGAHVGDASGVPAIALVAPATARHRICDGDVRDGKNPWTPTLTSGSLALLGEGMFQAETHFSG